ncbi:Uncharacterized protein CTRI78_v002586 [Colletotrichum trifolii]|uniref:2-oxoadipate dioxygenase/decarboxylase n=1 Tax=Colletotrichum trifolii TaxID=5466 RepID=A0A4R8RLR2_COLTR|nr:Uncharacterized protein CTRI78_v002586 [Colletotrichum trifolii]
MSAGLLSASRADRRGQPSPDAAYVDADSLRTTFALAISTMYKAEVPLYGDLMQIVQSVNRDAQTRRIQGLEGSATMDASVERLTLERHGAIRLGTPREPSHKSAESSVCSACTPSDTTISRLPAFRCTQPVSGRRRPTRSSRTRSASSPRSSGRNLSSRALPAPLRLICCRDATSSAMLCCVFSTWPRVRKRDV